MVYISAMLRTDHYAVIVCITSAYVNKYVMNALTTETIYRTYVIETHFRIIRVYTNYGYICNHIGG
jgi:hypothetical protein